MRKLILGSLIILMISYGSGQLDLGQATHNMTPLKPGETHEINVPVANTGSVTQSARFTLTAESKINSSHKNSIFAVSGELGGSNSTSFSSCSFSHSENTWTYKCPKDGRLNLNSDFNDNLTLFVTPPLNIRGGSDLLDVNVTADSRSGKKDEVVSVNGDNPSLSVGDLDFAINGTGVKGEIATAESFVFGEASNKELLTRFTTDITNQNSITVTYNFPTSLTKHYDYKFEMYNYSSGSWQSIEPVLDDKENTLTAEISGNGYYSLYIDRTKLSIQDLVNRETNVTKNVNGSEGDIKLENLGETENLSINLPALTAENGVKLNGFEIMSNVNDTASFSFKMLKELPNNVESFEEDYMPIGFAEVETTGNNTLLFKSYGFQMDTSKFNYSENIIGYRYTGDSWEKMNTRFLSQGASYSSFNAITRGNSLLSFGKYNSSIEIENIDHSKNLLDNETLKINVLLENDWRGKGEKTINYTLNGTEKSITTVEVDGSGNRTVEFAESNLAAGNYTLSINGKTSKLEVELRPIQYRILDRLPFNNVNILYALIALIVIIPVALSIYTKRENIAPYVTPYTTKVAPYMPEDLNIPIISSSDEGEEYADESTNEQVEDLEQKERGEEDTSKNELEPGEKDLECEECGRSFDSLSELKNHTKKVHEESADDKDGDYLCAICGETFDTVTGLELHHKKFHEMD